MAGEEVELSRAEFSGSDERFAVYDLDGNGFLSTEEQQAGQQAQEAMDAVALTNGELPAADLALKAIVNVKHEQHESDRALEEEASRHAAAVLQLQLQPGATSSTVHDQRAELSTQSKAAEQEFSSELEQLRAAEANAIELRHKLEARSVAEEAVAGQQNEGANQRALREEVEKERAARTSAQAEASRLSQELAANKLAQEKLQRELEDCKSSCACVMS